MDQPKDTETPSAPAAKAELPAVESPSISPADLVKTIDSDLEPASKPIPELAAETPQAKPDAKPQAKSFDGIVFTPLPLEPKRILLRPRHKRYALLAASVAVAAALGGVIGALATGGPSTPPVNVAALEESKAMQQSVAKLAKEVTTLKANLEEANKATRAQVAKVETKLDSKIDNKIARLDERLKKEADDVTGSIAPPQTVAAAAPQAPVPMPTPRPAQRVAFAESQAAGRLPIVPGWSIRDARGGYLYVESRGDVYQIVPGASLPGLGPVESIRRLEGRWVVKTPRGIIVSMRDRRYFE